MDFALITNLLLFLGAMGVTFALDGGANGNDDDERSDDDAPSQPATRMIAMDAAHSGDDSLAADRDNLAWFLTSGEVYPVALPSHGFAALPAPDVPPEAAQDTGADMQEPPASESDTHAEAELPGPAEDDPAEAAPPAPMAETSIELAYLPALDPDTGLPLAPELGVTPTEDGNGSVIWLDGLEVARFDDLADLTTDQITLLPETSAPGDAPEDTTEEATDDPVVIEGFSPGADRIEIAYHPATDSEGKPLPPDVSVQHETEAEEQAALVLLDGHVVARVLGSGAAQLRPADIVTLPVMLPV
ncbi:hypothetical protein MASR2M74_35600 [Paracoccaceae bacterium]